MRRRHRHVPGGLAPRIAVPTAKIAVVRQAQREVNVRVLAGKILHRPSIQGPAALRKGRIDGTCTTGHGASCMFGRLGSLLHSRSASAALFAATGLLVVLAAPGVLPWRAAGFLAWFAFAPLLFALPAVSVRHAAKLGFFAGMIVNLGTCAWFPGLLARYANLHPAFAVAAAVLLAAWHSTGWAAWAAATRFVAPRVSPLLFAPLAFAVMERWMPWVFPFSLALTQANNPTLAQSAELGGPYLLSALCVAVGAAFASLAAPASRPARLAAILPFALLGAAAVFGLVRHAQVATLRRNAPALRLAAIQAGVAHTAWTRPSEDPNVLARYQEATARAEAQHGLLALVLWPERAYPGLLRSDAKHDYPVAHRSRIRKGFVSPLLFGVTSVNVQTRAVANSAAWQGADGRMEVFYHKTKLIPYSEWVPSFLQDRLPGGKRYEAGNGTGMLQLPLSRADGVASHPPVQAIICYETAFPSYVRDLVRQGPRLLVNLSDDSWFGNSAEPEQHLAHAILRAIESRRDLVRSTGSGVSAFVTAAGDVQVRTRMSLATDDVQTLFVEDARLLEMGSVYGAIGDLFAWACLVVVASAAGRELRRTVAGWLRTSSRGTARRRAWRLKGL